MNLGSPKSCPFNQVAVPLGRSYRRRRGAPGIVPAPIISFAALCALRVNETEMEWRRRKTLYRKVLREWSEREAGVILSFNPFYGTDK